MQITKSGRLMEILSVMLLISGDSTFRPRQSQPQSANKTSPPSPQAKLDKFVREFENTGFIDTRRLLGGGVLFESEFEKSEYHTPAMNLIMPKIGMIFIYSRSLPD
jgi:hypothetical protein